MRTITDVSNMWVDMHREILKSGKNSNHQLQISNHVLSNSAWDSMGLFGKKLQLSKMKCGGRRAQKLFRDPWGAGERNNRFV